MHVRVGLVFVVTGLGLGVVVAWTVLEFVDTMPALVWGALVFGVMLACAAGGREVARGIVRSAGRQWANVMAERYQLDPKQLYGYIRHM